MKSLIVHLEERSEDPKGLSMTKIPTGDARRLKQRSSMEHLEDGEFDAMKKNRSASGALGGGKAAGPSEASIRGAVGGLI